MSHTYTNHIMETNQNKNRRQFLRNASLAALSIGVLPKIALAKSTTKNSLLEAPKECSETKTDFYGAGPFYKENPPAVVGDQLARPDERGARVIISGRIYNNDCSSVLPNTTLDLWHADYRGEDVPAIYDTEGYNLRGTIVSNSQGFYMFETIIPGRYLNGAEFRPAHIHVKIRNESISEVITQIYFKGDPQIPGDLAASITSGVNDATNRIIDLIPGCDGKLEGIWDVVLNTGGQEALGSNTIYVDKGMIYSVDEINSQNSINISYGVFKEAKVNLHVFNTEGVQVADLGEQNLSPEKYTAAWQPDEALPNGYYFVAIKINNLQVHYKKMKLER